MVDNDIDQIEEGNDEFRREPCKNCPFRTDVTPYLHPDRAADIAYLSENPYSDFPCHETTEYDEETEDMEVTAKSKTCAGFLAMRSNMLGDEYVPKGFKWPKAPVYCEPSEMADAYEEEWNE